jgi:NhaA family Na+:H+ antiporter
MRRTSYDDSCIPSMTYSVRLPTRSRSLEDIESTQRRDRVDAAQTVIRNRSEGDHLIKNIRKFLELRNQRQDELAREIFSSRSLFDHRQLPPAPPPSPANASGNWKIRVVHYVRIIQHFFVPLQLGIVTALIWANVSPDSYENLWLSSDPHALTVHFFVNDVFMALFFGIAMVHVTTALLPGGSLHPLNKALSPLLGTIGGVVGPAAVYLSLVSMQGNFESQSNGWAVCIATDISVAWLIATQVFKSGAHPAVQFLLLLAVADDVIGLIVIAVCFPTGDIAPLWLLLILGSLVISCVLRWVVKVERWTFYILLAGPVAWYGLYRAGVHPALALCPVVPLIPSSNLEKFDHDCSLFVHIGLFFFALCNAGVVFDSIGLITLNVSISLILGKTLGIFTFSLIGTKVCGLKLPESMRTVDLGLLAHISGVGLTVALFVAELAFTDPHEAEQAKLGALLSVTVAPTSILLGRWLAEGAHKSDCFSRSHVV